MTEIGFGVSRPTWRLRFGVDTDHFMWVPGEIESGKSSPAQYFDSFAEAYWLWGWLGFVVFYSTARNYY